MTHTKGRTKADHHTEGRRKRPTGGSRGTHTGNTQTVGTFLDSPPFEAERFE